MIDSQTIVLDVATPHDAPLIANLLELYAHDLSQAFNLELGADGRFGYHELSLYWSTPERRFPFVIRRGIRIVGFALIARGSPASDSPEDFDVAEFFIVRRHRRGGVGRRAAFLLFDRFPARWLVRVSEGNRSGWQFWARIIAEYTHGEFVETTLRGILHPWRVFSFSSAQQSTALERAT